MELYSQFFLAKRRFDGKSTPKKDVVKEIPFSEDVTRTCDKICRAMFECRIFSQEEIGKRSKRLPSFSSIVVASN